VEREIAFGALDIPTAQTIESAFGEGGNVAVDGGAPQAGDLGGLLAGQAAVEHSEDIHLAADVFPRMSVSHGLDDLLLLLREVDGKPAHLASP
jgi:hypothetical protein